MAEGIQLSSFSTKYYCHHCSREVSPFHTAELICPDCSSGFLEEVSGDMFSDETYSFPDDEYESDLEDVSNISFIPDPMDGFIGRVLMSVAEENSPDAQRQRRRIRSIHDAVRHNMRRFLAANDEDVEESRLWGFRYFDDYTGDEEVDALASQLLDEVEISGPPPLSKNEIKSLPSLAITADLLEKGMQCTVCMDDFNLKEKAKRLPCNHLYHEKCITPWLERQATCPNCREVIHVDLPSKRARSCLAALNVETNEVARHVSELSSLNDYFTSLLRYEN